MAFMRLQVEHSGMIGGEFQWLARMVLCFRKHLRGIRSDSGCVSFEGK